MTKKKKIVVCLILTIVAVLGFLACIIASWYAPRSKYYGIIDKFDAYSQTFSDGSTVYTPGSEHITDDGAYNALYYNNVLLVFTQSDLSQDQIQELANTVEGTPVGVIRGAIHAVQILVDPTGFSQLKNLSQKLMMSEHVLYASCEYPVQIMNEQEPANSTDSGNWWIEAIDAHTAWQYSDQCQEIKVGIVDTGFDAAHEDLQGQLIPVLGDLDSLIPNSHGTHVAGIIAALDNDIGIRGIADHAQLYCADVWPLDSSQSYHTMAEFLAAVNIMVQSGVRIINNSWCCLAPSANAYIRDKYGILSKLSPYIPMDGGYGDWIQQRMQQDLIPTSEACIVMLSQLINAGYEDLLMVQAAGNGLSNGAAGIGADARLSGFFCGVTQSVFDGLEPALLEKLSSAGITYESIDDRILIVGAVKNSTDENGNYYTVSSFSYGETVDICAPGSNIFSTVLEQNGTYANKSGTSMAAPVVTGCAAYIWSLDPSLSVSEVRQLLLEATTVSAIGTGAGAGYTYPMVNLGQSVTKMMEN